MAGSENSSMRDEFVEELRLCTWPGLPSDEDSGACPEYRQFVNMPRLVAWMTTTIAGSDNTNIRRLLNEMNVRLNDFTDFRLTAGNDESCLHLLACLLSINAPQLFNVLARKGINDASMSRHIRRDTRTRIEEALDHDSLDAWRQFYKRRWSFSPKHLDSDFKLEGTYELERRIMPFCLRQSKTPKGGTSDVYEVLVPMGFISESIMQHLSAPFESPLYGWCYELAIKTFASNQEETFERERDAFLALRSQEGIIKCFGSYYSTSTDPESSRTTTTFNLILEYSKMDLQDMYEETAPPMLADAMADSWDKIFEVSKALKNIHHLQAGNGEYRGWHGDVKPDNILVVFERDREKFKLADFGFAEFREYTASSGRRLTALMRGGTEDFGAPDSSDEKEQSIDIWSFGCVLSVHASWLVGGSYAVHTFTAYRYNTRTNLGLGAACFHDGTSVLPEVLAWHRRLLENARKSDMITPQVLELVETRMLRPEGQRIEATELRVELEKILSAAKRATPGGTADPIFLDALNRAKVMDRARMDSQLSSLRASKNRTVGHVESTRPATLSSPVTSRPPSRRQASRINPRNMNLPSIREPSAVTTDITDRPQSIRRTAPALPLSPPGSDTYSNPRHNSSASAESAVYARLEASNVVRDVAAGKDQTTSAFRLQELLSQFPDLVQERDRSGVTHAMRAARVPLREEAKLRVLVDASNPHHTDHDRQNILHHLAQGLADSPASLLNEAFLRDLASIFAREEFRLHASDEDVDFHAPLYFPTVAGKLSVVKFLCNHLGAEPSTKLLKTAAKKGADDIVKFYVKERGVRLDLEARDALDWATWDKPTKKLWKDCGLKPPPKK